MDAETLGLLTSAKYEIKHLRSLVDQFRPKAEAYDMMRAALLGPPQPQVFSVDVVHQIDEHLRALQTKAQKEEPND